MKCVENTEDVCLPYRGGNQNKDLKKTPMCLWNAEMQPFKAMFWHAIWVSAVRPMNTQLHQLMKKTRNAYHFQIRKCKKMKDILKRNTD